MFLLKCTELLSLFSSLSSLSIQLLQPLLPVTNVEPLTDNFFCKFCTSTGKC